MSDTSLWQFALSLWKRPGVERAALVLQDQHGVSVCLALAAVWLSRRDVLPDARLAEAMTETARVWEQQRVAPLRGLRRQASARGDWGDWRRLLQEAELEAERLLLLELEGHLQARPVPRGDTQALSWLLLVLPEAAQCESLSQALDTLVEAASQ
ncbi:TIGR02444 family protein [Alcanivorax sp. JB21]|uniref:TIGR02444 family protein n=1 Tax=Alcanivorax limicola TaxID=2874102 RepID=UPI001CBC1AB5|nr:TIGR02444 family protein [Alcanivorax limicola]MBZ2190337.1 TIGR02444 family protein [Alcanivorax limicola]